MRRLILTVLLVLGMVGQAWCWGWSSWSWFPQHKTTVISGYEVSGGGYYLLAPSHSQSYIPGHSGYEVSGGGYYLLAPSHSQSYIVNP